MKLAFQRAQWTLLTGLLASCGPTPAQTETTASSSSSSTTGVEPTTATTTEVGTTGVGTTGVGTTGAPNTITATGSSTGAPDTSGPQETSGPPVTAGPPQTSGSSDSTTEFPGTSTLEPPGTSGLPGECLIGDVTIDAVNTEAKIAALAGIECITGFLLFENVDRADMQGLESLRHMDVLEIRWSTFTSLAGLENLEFVRALSVWQNPGLTDIGALANLEIEGLLDLREIPITSLPFTGLVHLKNTLLIRDTALTSLAGLDALESVGSLRIQDNQQLTSLAGLGKLASVSEGVFIENNPGLVDVAGMGALDSVGEEFEVYDNDALVSLAGLTLGSVGALQVTENAKLKSLAGLENLAEAPIVRITLNPALTSVAALQPDGMLVTGALTIRDNGALPTCAARAVADAQLALDYLCIHNNKLDACSDDPGLCLAP